MGLNADQKQRYARHLALPEIGAAGQERLLAGRVLVVGAGGLGSPAAFYLAAAGVGTLGLMDGDVVELSNLQRQILHTTGRLGRRKVDSAAETLRALDPQITVQLYPERLTVANAPAVLAHYDFVIDATDNFASKFMIADVCHGAGKPYSHGGILKFLGQTMTVHPGQTACYRCLFDGPPPEVTGAAPQGPLGAVPGVIGTIQATEAIKHLLGLGQPLTNCLLVYDALTMTFRRIPAPRNPRCRLCGDGARG
jgi:molybdopterin-synthase adenylyltransferase